ncbi:hypothetical protein [Cohnella rhizosphaerae]|uniref:hypothetical protein n=1 Tax=Cohnella rhizosphaerae TaxID=1457232 RepID=UPI0024058D99|nr:hypothetical protein [Cohnella rhizosphaerae]
MQKQQLLHRPRVNRFARSFRLHRMYELPKLGLHAGDIIVAELLGLFFDHPDRLFVHAAETRLNDLLDELFKQTKSFELAGDFF